MGCRILITPRSFGKNDERPIQILVDRGYELVMNPYERIMTEEEMIEHIKDVDGIILGVDPLNSNVLKHAKQLKAISRYGVGLDNIDMEYAANAGIKVMRTIGANSDSVADYTITLLLAAARRLVSVDKECRRLNWRKPTSIEMWNKTLGLIGLGSIGKGVAKRASGFNMKVLAYDIYKDENYAGANNIEYVSFGRLLKDADFISIHLPLTEKTKKIISFKEFEMMKNRAVIVNTARGGIIDEDALLWALKENRIWGAGVDVFEEEPPRNKELLTLDNITIGSHCAASTFEAISSMGMIAADNLIQCLESV